MRLAGIEPATSRSGGARLSPELQARSTQSSPEHQRGLDLKTGKGLVLPRQARSGWNDASVGALGIVYAVNSYKAYGGRHPSGSLVFVPTARVLAGIARGQLK